MLPIMTSPDDVSEVVDYLKTKAMSVTLNDAKAAIDNRLLDPRKISAYEAWDFIEKDESGLRLSEFGRKFSRASGEVRREMFGEVIRADHAYRIATEWMFHHGFDTVAAVDLAAHWSAHVPDELETENEKTVRNQVTTFFQLAEGAGLGGYVVGRRSQPTRLDIDRDRLGQFIGQVSLQQTPAATDARPDEHDETNDEAPDEQGTDDMIGSPEGNGAQAKQPTPAKKPQESPRVFISHGKNVDIVDKVKTMLEFADLEFEVAVEEETSAIPVPDKVLEAMRRCSTAVICVTADRDMHREGDTYGVNENVLIEIGAAFVLYEKRVVLVWDRRVPVPSNLQGLYRCEFEGDDLDWSAGMKLMKAVSNFKKHDMQPA